MDGSMIDIRRVLTTVEDTHHEFGPRPAAGLRRGAIALVVGNPYAGRYERDLLPMMDALTPIGIDMAERLCRAMDAAPERIESYGKGAIVGSAGELEHGALWHVPGGYAMRELLGWKGDRVAYARGEAPASEGTASRAAVAERVAGDAAPARQPNNALAIVPATKKVGAPGATLDVPLTHINASYVRSHFDAIEVRVPGAPAADEIVFVLAMATGPRIHQRVGGLKAADIALWNGLR